MAQYDIEAILGDVKSFLTTNLNTQITALNTEKNDGVSLKTVDSTAYHLQYLEDRAELQDPIICYGEAGEPVIQAIGPSVAVTYQVGIWLILADIGTDTKIVQKLFRYRRLLIELFRTNWASFARENKMKIAASSPTPAFQNMETQYTGRAVGVIISLTVVA